MLRDFREANGIGIQFQHISLRLPVDSGDLLAFQLTAPHGTSALLSQEPQGYHRCGTSDLHVKRHQGRIPGDSYTNLL